MKNQLETETDLNLLAADMGWDYMPACDEAFLLLADMEQIDEPAQPAQPKVNKRKLRQQLIRETMPSVKDDQDWQMTAHEILNDGRWDILWQGKDEEERDAYIMGVVRFCEHACGYTRW
mgnify:CR=1 FL=1